MIEIRICSKDDLDKNLENSNNKTLVISITDRKNKFVKLEHLKSKDLALFIRFDDVEKGESGEITDKDAQDIIKFINENIDDTVTIIVSCDGGVSRSPAVAAAISLMLGIDDYDIWTNGWFCPNETVFACMIQNIFPDTWGEIDINNRIQNNIQVWREQNL